MSRLIALGLLLFATASLADGGGPHAELLAQADAIIDKVAEARGLKVKRAIKRGVMNKDQLKERLLKRVAEQYTPAEIEGESMSMKRFGLLDADANYLEVVMALLTDQIAGFYDPFEGELYLSDSSTVGGEMLLAHEVVHALQDQHFDLAKFMLAEKDNADATMARQALIEGDGVALMMEHLLAGMGKSAPWGEEGFADEAAKMTSQQASSIKGAPFVLRESLVFPYADGLRFVAHFRKHNTWSRIDKIFAKPPLSTEHILHPRVYETYEKPIVITATKPQGLGDYSVLYQNVAGEKAIGLLLEAHGIAKSKAALAATGWGGDAMVVLAPPKHGGKLAGTIGVLRTRWDYESDAIEFFDAVSHALPSLAGNGPLVAEDPKGIIRYRNQNGAVVSVERNGADVVLIVGAPPAREPDIRLAAFAWTAR